MVVSRLNGTGFFGEYLIQGKPDGESSYGRFYLWVASVIFRMGTANRLTKQTLLLLIGFVGLVLSCAPVVASPSSSPKVLVIWSYHETLPWQHRVHEGMEQRLLNRREEVRPILFEESLDDIRLDYKQDPTWFYDYLRNKYDGVQFDFVITESGPAAELLSSYTHLFSGAQRYFVNSDKIFDTKLGIQLAVKEDFERHLKVALDLQPNARKLVVIGNLFPDRVMQARSVWEKHFKNRVALETWTDDFTFAELYDRVAHLPEDAVVLYELVSHDRTGAQAVPYEVLTKLSAASTVPVFATHDTLMGSGTVGGYLMSGERVGWMMADLMAGALPSSFSNEYFSLFQFDDRALKHWEIPESRLPADRQLLFREAPIFETHGRWIAFISVESLLLLALGWSLLGRHRAIMQLRDLAILDSLTGTYNRREFLRLLNDELARVKRLPAVPTTVLMLDIDHFKSINDTYGHPAGDAALTQMGVILKETVRRVDSVGRMGGEEFAILLVGTDLDNGVEFAERLRLAIAQARVVFDDNLIQWTASIGVSQIEIGDSDAAAALARADKALYAAKDRGRNCVVSVTL